MTGQYEEKIAKANRKVAVANNILKYGYDCEPYLLADFVHQNKLLCAKKGFCPNLVQVPSLLLP